VDDDGAVGEVDDPVLGDSRGGVDPRLVGEVDPAAAVGHLDDQVCGRRVTGCVHGHRIHHRDVRLGFVEVVRRQRLLLPHPVRLAVTLEQRAVQRPGDVVDAAGVRPLLRRHGDDLPLQELHVLPLEPPEVDEDVVQLPGQSPDRDLRVLGERPHRHAAERRPGVRV